mmetsp:Transcript_43695/g.110627  ORF Transcript_43695/g.110627 Transcript_43695/m.110627 type:complete len:219 (+) Transcript_43695:581-1237(+)
MMHLFEAIATALHVHNLLLHGVNIQPSEGSLDSAIDSTAHALELVNLLLEKVQALLRSCALGEGLLNVTGEALHLCLKSLQAPGTFGGLGQGPFSVLGRTPHATEFLMLSIQTLRASRNLGRCVVHQRVVTERELQEFVLQKLRFVAARTNLGCCVVHQRIIVERELGDVVLHQLDSMAARTNLRRMRLALRIQAVTSPLELYQALVQALLKLPNRGR